MGNVCRTMEGKKLFLLYFQTMDYGEPWKEEKKICFPSQIVKNSFLFLIVRHTFDNSLPSFTHNSIFKRKVKLINFDCNKNQ